MKKLIISILLLCTISCEKEIENQLYPPSNNLCGIWYGYGYNCFEGPTPPQIILIQHIEDTVIAYKLTGDQCVQAGQMTWRGIFNQDSITNSILNTYYFTISTNITIVSQNYLIESTGGNEFIRATNEQIDNEIQDIYFKAHNTYLNINLEGICKPQNY